MTIDTSKPSLPLLKLMQLSSASLPVGGYAYSQGLETAVDRSLIADVEQTFQWLQVQLRHGLGTLDLAVILRLYKAFADNDSATVQYWNQYLLASRETKELLFADVEMAKALIRLLGSLGMDYSSMGFSKRYIANDVTTHSSFTAIFALAAWRWGITAQDCCSGYCWSWLENQAAAATKLVPLGQTQAQQLITRLQPLIPEAISKAEAMSDDEIGASQPGVAIASAQHETQYSRLFRS